MGAQNNNPRPDEGDLLAFVEGVAMPADRRAALARALEADPALARRLERMRADREALASLGEVGAPAGLMDAVEAALERRALLGMERDAAEGPIPVSLVRPERRGIWQTFMADRMGRRLAAAAAVLLVLGGASFMVARSMSGPTGPGIVDRPLALKDPSPEAGSASFETLTKSDAPAGGERVAAADSAMEKVVDPAAPPEALAANQAPTAPAISAADAVRLAREHRLLITIRVKDAGQTISRLDRMADRLARTSGSGSWRIAQQVPQELAAALGREPAQRVPGAPDAPEPTLAGADPAPVRITEAPPIVHLPTSGEIAGLYIVESRLDEASLALVARAFEGPERTVEFTELAEPLAERALPRDLVISPASVLWWSRPASAGWAAWTRVPVVVEPSP